MPGFVFVSHSTSDAAYVARLAEHLQAAKIPAWIDNIEMRPGDRWEQVVRDQIDACAVMLVVMSPQAEASPHVANELDRARRRDIPVLPLLLGGEPFFSLGALHYGDVRDGELPDDRFMTRLIEMASAELGSNRPPIHRPWPNQLVVGDVPGAAVAWQDRPDLLGRVALLAAGGQTAVVCALAGQRGVGKTQLAAAYARMRIQQGWPVVVWAVAETVDGIVNVLDEVATEAGIRPVGVDPRRAARTAMRWLQTHPGPTLLVYDNAVDADLIRRWTPPIGSVHTVVTTTRRGLRSLGDLVDVDLFSDAQAVAYLGERTGLVDSAGAALVSAALGSLPLALAQAGTVVGTRRRYPTYAKYLRGLARTSTATLLPRTSGDLYPHGTAEAILLSLDDLAAADPDGRARRLLNHLAVLAPIGADAILLHHLAIGPLSDQPDSPIDEDADALVAVLADRSLIVPGADTDRVVVHRLIQRVLRERCQNTGTIDDVIASAFHCLHGAIQQIGEGWATRALLTEYAAHASALTAYSIGDTGRQATPYVQTWIVIRLTQVRNFAAAHSFGESVVIDREWVFGPPLHPDQPRRPRRAYRMASQMDEAIALYEQNLADLQRVLGPDHRETLTSRDSLARAYRAAIGWTRPSTCTSRISPTCSGFSAPTTATP